MNIAVLGCGNWGSVFGIMQHHNGHKVTIWEYNKTRALQVMKTRRNEPFLKGHLIPQEVVVHYDLAQVLSDAECVVFAIPCQVLRSVVQNLGQMHPGCQYYLSLTKGIEVGSSKRPSEIISELPDAHGRVFVLSGPSIANEVIKGIPTAVVLVGEDVQAGQYLQHQLAHEAFRIYQSDDMIGVELGAALKNVIALGCGMSDGLGFGNNAKGALVTRGIVEIQRLGTALGAQTRTFWGLSGLGDLATTSFSSESRNHRCGTLIAKGYTLEQISEEMVMVAEGVPTSQAVRLLSTNMGIPMPISTVVYEIVHERKSVHEGLRDLMERPLKYE
jgi:glycerol-3-phosphate dehydrogenase (NAD(P)+)